MATAYTLEEVQSFIPGKTWNDLPLDMQASAIVYAYAQQIPGYYLILPPTQVDELAALVAGHSMELIAVSLSSGVFVLPFDVVMDSDTFGYAHTFLSGLIIRFVADSEFPPDTSGI